MSLSGAYGRRSRALDVARGYRLGSGPLARAAVAPWAGEGELAFRRVLNARPLSAPERFVPPWLLSRSRPGAMTYR